MSTITYTDTRTNTEATIPLGKNYELRREVGDICLARAIAVDCPVSVAVLIRKDGHVSWWYTEFDGNSNVYWHFSNGSLKTDEITDDQRKTMQDMQGGVLKLFGLSGALGAPVLEMVFGNTTANIARAMHS